MKTRNKILALLLCLVMVLSLAACGGSSSSSDSSGGDSASSDSSGGGSGGSGTALEVRIWDNNQLAGLQEIADEWTATSGIPVNIQVITWDEYWTLLEAGASGGQMPDVFWMHSNNANLYMSNDMLLDLTPYIEESGVDMSNYYADIAELYSYDGKQYAMPKDHDTIALLYNKAIFDQYGVDYPTDDWTWEDYYNAGKAITDAGKADGVYGAAMNTTNDQDGFLNIIYSFGGTLLSEDKTTSGWTDPNTMAAMEFVGRCCSDVFCPQSTVAESGTDVLFRSNTVAMISQGSWMLNSFANEPNVADYGWAMLPYYDANGNGQPDEGERCTIYNGLGWSASASTAQPDACWELINWFSTEEMQIKQAELGVTMAGYIGASDGWVDACTTMDVSAFLRMETEGTLVMRPYSQKYTLTWYDAFQKGLVPAFQDPTQMESVLQQLQEETDAILAQEG